MLNSKGFEATWAGVMETSVTLLSCFATVNQQVTLPGGRFLDSKCGSERFSLYLAGTLHCRFLRVTANRTLANLTLDPNRRCA
jgi:hypothetical protein